MEKLIFILLFLVSYSFITINEDTLIIMGNFFWLYLFIDYIKQLIINELDYKSLLIKEKIVYYKNEELRFINKLLKLYNLRGGVKRGIVGDYTKYIFKYIDIIVLKLYISIELLELEVFKSDIINFGELLVNEVKIIKLVVLLNKYSK